MLATKEELEDLYNEINDLEQNLVELDDTIDNNERSIKLLSKKQNPLPGWFILSGVLLFGFTVIFWPFIIFHFNLKGVLIANLLFSGEITFILLTFSIIATFFGLILYRLIPETEDLIKMKSQISMNRQERIRKNRSLKQMNYRAMKFQTEVEERKILEEKALERETAKDYDSAINIWERLEEIEEAARIRTLKAEQGSVKVAQKVVQGDEISKTEIKDSVLNRSSVGGSSSKMQELKDLTEMKEKGLISDEEFEKMKKEIIE